jgi:hypothetical protein
MSIGTDVAEVIAEVGSSIVILRDSGNISGEYSTIETNEQSTKPIVSSFFKKATFQYNTGIVQGDIISFDTTEDYYLVTTINSEEFENAIITKQAVLYLCNVSGELSRPSGEAWNSATYHKEQSWETIKSNCYALLVNPEFYNKLVAEEVALLGTEENELFLPHSVGATVNDRYEATSGEQYKIEVVNSYRYLDVDVCRITEDTR